MTPVGGIVVTVSLFAVAVAAVFGAHDVGLLECRAGGEEGRRREEEAEGGHGEQESEINTTFNTVTGGVGGPQIGRCTWHVMKSSIRGL